jgi:type IV pilus assembly protein PilE
MRNGKQRGFTLIELMITVAIVALLAAVAYPAYTSHIIKGKRAAAKAQIMDIANREQQYLLANRTYADKTQLEATGYALPKDVSDAYDYAIEVGASTAPTYTVTFTAKGTQATDGNLTMNSSGAKTPIEKW